MARFSLSPAASSIKRVEGQCQAAASSASSSEVVLPKWKWIYPPQDGYYRQTSVESSSCSSSNDDSSSSSSSSEQLLYEEGKYESSSDDDEEEEPPHPLGFARYGITRFGLSPVETSFNNDTENNIPPHDIFNREDEYAWNALISIDSKVAGNNNYIPTYHLNTHGNYVPTKKLLSGASSLQYQQKQQQQTKDEEEDMEEILCGMDRIANLVKAASCVIKDSSSAQTNQYETTSRSTSKLLQLAQICEQQQANLSHEMKLIQQQKSQSYQQTCQGFLLLLQADKDRACAANERMTKRQQDIAAFEEQERLDEIAYTEHKEKQRLEAERLEAERTAAETAKSDEVRAKHEQHLQYLAIAEKEAEEEAAKKTAYITRAKSLINNLEAVRSTLVEFDKSKVVSRRRLTFKKIVNGKINTLSHDKNKILEVSRLVGEAINSAAHDDNSAGGGGGADAVMTMGRKYLLDLLCSNLIVRVQADGFNGTRGDGFPLANMFAQISCMCEEIGPVLEGHLYMVCRMAIPALSLDGGGVGTAAVAGGNNDDEDALMTSLGMIRDKNGEFESFDKFLHRTEVRYMMHIVHACACINFLSLTALPL